MIQHLTGILQTVAILGCISSCIYYLVCLRSVAAFLRASKTGDAARSLHMQPVSILKPLKGIDPEIYESFRSHCLQDYPEYEVIFGVSDPADPAVASVEELRREFPDRSIQLI